MVKQVKTTPVQPELEPINGTSQNLHVSVKTFDAEGRTIGERIVDMHHFGTRNWLQNHLWWATHHGHCTEVNIASPEEIEAYLASGREALAAKFNDAPAEVEAVAA